jgi:hypothetical protein
MLTLLAVTSLQLHCRRQQTLLLLAMYRRFLLLLLLPHAARNPLREEPRPSHLTLHRAINTSSR